MNFPQAVNSTTIMLLSNIMGCMRACNYESARCSAAAYQRCAKLGNLGIPSDIIIISLYCRFKRHVVQTLSFRKSAIINTFYVWALEQMRLLAVLECCLQRLFTGLNFVIRCVSVNSYQ